MLRVALTGGIATGKSYVRARLAGRGVPTLDADALAREAVAPGSTGLAEVVARFGPAVLDAGGRLDRRAMGRIAFADSGARRDLEAIIHPRVRAATAAWYAALPAGGPVGFAVADIPLLYETGREADFDAVLVTVCPEPLQVARIVARDGLSEAEARARIAAQLPLAAKAARADHVIDTGGTFDETDRQVDAVAEALAAAAATRG